MKKFSIKNAGSALTSAAIDGGSVYLGRKIFQVLNYKLGGMIPGNLNPVINKVIIAAAGVVLADAILPPKHAKLAGIGMAEEVVEAVAAPVIDNALAKSNLISADDLSRGQLAAGTVSLVDAGTSTAGYSAARMMGYSAAGMRGYSSVRGMGAVGLASGSAFGL